MEFYQTLRKSAGGAAVKYLFLGDLNTMGMEYLFKPNNIPADIELKKVDSVAGKHGMRRLAKDRPITDGATSRGKSSPAPSPNKR